MGTIRMWLALHISLKSEIWDVNNVKLELWVKYEKGNKW